MPVRARAGVPVLYPQRCVSAAERHATLEGVTSINGTSSLLRRTFDAAERGIPEQVGMRREFGRTPRVDQGHTSCG